MSARDGVLWRWRLPFKSSIGLAVEAVTTDELVIGYYVKAFVGTQLITR